MHAAFLAAPVLVAGLASAGAQVSQDVNFNATNARLNISRPGLSDSIVQVNKAKAAIQDPANSAGPYCSSILNYTAPLTTLTATVTNYSTSTISVSTEFYTTVDVTPTSYVFSNMKRAAVTDPANIPSFQKIAARMGNSTVSEPSVLSKFPASIVSSACVLAIRSTVDIVTVLQNVVINEVFVPTDIATNSAAVPTTVAIPCAHDWHIPYPKGNVTTYDIHCNVALSSHFGTWSIIIPGTTTWYDCTSTCADHNDPYEPEAQDEWCFAFEYHANDGNCTLYGVHGDARSTYGGGNFTGVDSAGSVFAVRKGNGDVSVGYAGPTGSA